MGREQAVAQFVKENLGDLLSAGATHTRVKQMRQTFTEHHHLEPADRFTLLDVGLAVVEKFVSARREIATDQLEASLLDIPFIRDDVGASRVRDTIELSRPTAQRQLTAEDMRRLREEEYLRKVEAQFEAKANSEAQTRISEDRLKLLAAMKAVVEKKEALDAIQSALDSVPPEADLETLVEVAPAPDDSGPVLPWWKDFGLEANPFSSNLGLDNIPEEKYDSVVVPTPFVNSYVARMDSDPFNYFGKTLVVLGAFGSGKSTLLKFIASHAGRKGVFPIGTEITSEPSFPKPIHQFLSQVGDSVLEAFPGRVDEDPRPVFGRSDEVARLVHILGSTLVGSSVTKGYLILVDGLHKPEKYLDRSLEFLQQLQSIQERLNQKKVPCGIIVAGSPRWESELRNNPSMSGSFYSIDTIPPLTEDSAIQAVIRRIASFTPSGTVPPRIVSTHLSGPPEGPIPYEP